jgi:transposase
MLTCNYQFKLKPTKRQIIEIENYLTACRKVWNYALAERKDYSCPECSFSCNRDFAASLVMKNRGINAVGQSVSQKASGEVLTGLGESKS